MDRPNFKPGDVVLSLEDAAMALTVEEVGTETVAGGLLGSGVLMVHCVTFHNEKAERHWIRANRLILCRKTRFAVGNSFKTVNITSRGLVEPGDVRPIVPMEKGLEEQRKVRSQRKQIVEAFRAAHPGQLVCYWYNWLADIQVNLERQEAMATERGCPAIYDPDVDAEFDDELYPARTDAAGNPIFPKVA